MAVNIICRFNLISKKLQSHYKNRHRLGMSGYSQLFFYSFLFCYPSFSAAGPTGGSVVGGSGNIHLHSLTTEIHQTSSSLALEWNSFNINSNEIVNFVQPTSSSIALNQILSTRASDIRGQINANGQVVLVNPNGIFFGPTSSVNVGGLIASGLNISTSDFMNGDYIFNEVLGTDGFVVNSGLINASLGGSGGDNVALLGKQVTNKGIISTSLWSGL
jgi:filamentous hemagglutinin family protein